MRRKWLGNVLADIIIIIHYIAGSTKFSFVSIDNYCKKK